MQHIIQKITATLRSQARQLLATGLLLSVAGCASVTQQAVAELEKSQQAGKYDEAISIGRNSIATVCKEKDAATCQTHKRAVLTKIGDIQTNNLNQYAAAEASYSEALSLTPQSSDLMEDDQYRATLQRLYIQLAYVQDKQNKRDATRTSARIGYYIDPSSALASGNYRKILERVRASMPATTTPPPAAPAQNKKGAKKPQPAPSARVANPELQAIDLELERVNVFASLWGTLQPQLDNAKSRCPSPATSNNERQAQIEQYQQNICEAEKRTALALALQAELNKRFSTHGYDDFIDNLTAKWKRDADYARNEIKSAENWLNVQKATASYAYNQCLRNGNCTPSQIASYREAMQSGYTAQSQELARAGEAESLQAMRQQQAALEEQRRQEALQQAQLAQQQRQQWQAQQQAAIAQQQAQQQAQWAQQRRVQQQQAQQQQVARDNAHNPANEAAQCVSIVPQEHGHGLDFMNNCAITITLNWCVDSNDPYENCNNGYKNLINLRAGGRYSTLAKNPNSDRYKYAACKGAGSIATTNGSFQYACPDKYQKR